MRAFSQPALAAEKGLEINADTLSYDKTGSIVDARGSVEVIYKDVKVLGSHIVYDASLETVNADGGFTLFYEGLTIEGESLQYQIKQKAGQAHKYDFNFQGIALSGDRLNFTEEQYILKNASFSTCPLAEPHYHVSAGEIDLYPKYGWLVAYWGLFWINRFPLVPVPTYIYDIQAEEKGKRNLPPFPEVSSNDQDGLFINERLAWHVRRELSGTYSINYAAKKGVGAGFDTNYIVSDTSLGDTRLYGNVTDGLWGGVTHRLFFGKEIEGEGETPFAFFAMPKYRQFEMDANLAYRERINYQRVSNYPDITLKSRMNPILNSNAQYDAQIKAGKIEEESNISLGRVGGDVKAYMPIGILTPSLLIDGSFYSNGGKWVKSIGGIDLRKKYAGNVQLGLGYQHYFSVDGQSPFNFEMYRFNTADRLTADLFFVLGETGVDIATSYFLDSWRPEDIDYSLFIRMHCYNLVAKYRSLRNEFTLGVSLAGQE